MTSEPVTSERVTSKTGTSETGTGTSETGRPGGGAFKRRSAFVLGAALVLGGFGVTGCAAISAARKVVHDVRGNRSTIDAFTKKITPGGATSFEATYVTTGSSPATIIYAVEPPKGLAFKETPSGSHSGGATALDVIVNGAGEYSCTSATSSGSPPSCEKLGKTSAAAQNKIFGFYTPAHWVAFLRDFSLAAGFAGDKVTSSTMTVNGFAMSCVDFRASGVPGTSTICSTAQGLLGYVKVAGNSTSFEIKSYSSSPPASLFDLPPGAKIVIATTGTT